MQTFKESYKDFKLGGGRRQGERTGDALTTQSVHKHTIDSSRKIKTPISKFYQLN